VANETQELEETFDRFYGSTRRELLIQVLALTGDLPAGQSAVRNAYAAAWRRWRRVSRLDDPLTWVRRRAWRMAKRRHTARPWHRARKLPDEQLRVLRSLALLPTAQRRLLVAVELAGLDLSAAATELHVDPESAEDLLRRATGTFVVGMESDVGAEESLPPRNAAQTREAVTPQREVGAALRSLDVLLDGAALQRGSRLRRSGRKRRRTQLVAAAACASVLAVAAGTLVYEPHGAANGLHGDGPSPSPSPKVAAKMPTGDDLLDAAQIGRVAPAAGWRATGTTNNTSGDGINTVCQRSRFADPKGYAALVRTFHGAHRSAVQTVEVSRSRAAAQRAFDTTLGWYAGCTATRVQLTGTYDVHGIGDQAELLVLHGWRRPQSTISVGVARSGSVITSTVVNTPGLGVPSAARRTTALATAVFSLCARTGTAGCVRHPSAHAGLPPPSGEGSGLLAVADLPPVGSIERPWVGTHPVTPRKNPAATTCDDAAFAAAGARQRRSRTYLIPQAQLPARFGLTETFGRFRTAKAAARFLAGIRMHVAGCEKRDLAAKVGATRTRRTKRADMSRWDLTLAVSAKNKVPLRIAFVRVGNRVAQLTFVPAARDDINDRAFDALLVRAGQRLHEL
jgi:DNA-directed RNA polymerase specialized sigma24 family protein